MNRSFASSSSLWISTLAVLMAGSAQAQPSGRPAVTGVGASLEVSSTWSGETTLRESGSNVGEVSTHEIDAEVTQRLGAFSVGAGYELHSIDLPGSNTTVAVPDRLRSVEMKFGYRWEITDDWSGFGFVQPGWHTATGGDWLDSDGIGVRVILAARRQWDAQRAFSAGLMYNSLARSSYRLLPFVGFEWRPADQWSVTAGFPRTGVTYAVSDQLNVSLQAEGSGGGFHVEKAPLPASLVGRDLNDQKLQFVEVRVGVGAEYALSDAFELQASVGAVVSRSFHYHELGYKLRSKDAAPYVSVGGRVRF